MGYVRGKVSLSANSSIPVLDPIVSGAGANSLSSEAVPSAADASAQSSKSARREPTQLTQSTIIGDLKLTVLKGRLTSLGITAEFAGEGVLVCGGASGDATASLCAVKKTGRGQVVLEGAASDVYYTVRNEIYGLHAIIAA